MVRVYHGTSARRHGFKRFHRPGGGIVNVIAAGCIRIPHDNGIHFGSRYFRQDASFSTRFKTFTGVSSNGFAFCNIKMMNIDKREGKK